MPDIVQQVGAIAGLVAFVGLALLSMLCFAQARDLRRLREWAGGAPERDAEMREVTEAVAAERSEELRIAAEREERRSEREGLSLYRDSLWERLGYRLGRGGRAAAVIAVVIILGAVVAFGASRLIGNDSGGQGGNRMRKQVKKAAAKPGQIKVAVLNGTDVPGAAQQYGDKLGEDGFRVGAITDASTRYGTSAVMFAKNRKAEAEAVAKAVGINNVQPITQDVASIVTSADVAVVVGLDKASNPG